MKRVGIIFGGRSVEHEISVITAYQVIEAIDKEKFKPIPIYITKDGKWITGENLSSISSFKAAFPFIKGKQAFISPVPHYGIVLPGLFLKRQAIDIAFPLIHGTYGEDGTLQGLLELSCIPYVGSPVLGSSLCMDKIASKMIFKSLGFPLIPWLWFERKAWREEQDKIIKEIKEKLSFPLIVKPSNLGSSIGINISEKEDELFFALDVCFEYSERAIVEMALSDMREINCAILGNDEVIPSLCEEVFKGEKFLTYEEKYRKGKGMKGLGRKIPADIKPELKETIQRMAISSFKAFGLKGIARIDFFLRNSEIYINEINTIPGSLSFYLFEPLGISFKELITRVIDIGFEAYRNKEETKYSYEVSIF